MMNVESIALNSYFGVELAALEHPNSAARIICLTANEVKTLFHRLEVMDTIWVGGRRFVRCRSDIINPYPMLDLILQRGRSTISSNEAGYIAQFTNGKKGPVPGTNMHIAPKPGQRITYRGPKVKMWLRQFD
jgi:hypothetical protein